MIFKWQTFFETGIKVIDQQHQTLVDLINEAAPLLVSSTPTDAASVARVLDQLFDYADMHFKTEEGLMVTHGVDDSYREHHCAGHIEFISQLHDWRAALQSDATQTVGPSLLRYLTSWLTIHILDEDQRLTRQLWLLASGVNAAEAQQVVAQTDPTLEPARTALENALNELFAVLGERNQALQAANLQLQLVRGQLERRVAERTAELTDALEQMKCAQSQLLQSETMAAVGHLAAGVAHEINNPISFVSSNLGTLKTYVNDLLEVLAAYEDLEQAVAPQDVRRHRVEQARAVADLDFLRQDCANLFDESRNGLARVSKIVQDLKDFSQIDQTGWHETDLNAALESTLHVLTSQLTDKVTLCTELTTLPKLCCLSAQLNQVFMNLLTNAVQAIGECGHIVVRSGFSADEVWVEIEDDGAGMTEEVRRHIFEPFYTTKPVGQGTGLGLSMAFDIVHKRHGGRIDVKTSPGVGSTFRVSLPRQSLADPMEERKLP